MVPGAGRCLRLSGFLDEFDALPPFFFGLIESLVCPLYYGLQVMLPGCARGNTNADCEWDRTAIGPEVLEVLRREFSAYPFRNSPR